MKKHLHTSERLPLAKGIIIVRVLSDLDEKLYSIKKLTITPNTQGNNYTFEMEFCMDAWLNGCMKNDSKRLSICIYTATYSFITYNHTTIHSYLSTAEIGNINR